MPADSRKGRLLERGKDAGRVLGFSVSATGNILSAIAKSLGALGSRNGKYLKEAGKDVLHALGNLTQGIDSGISAVTGITRETIGAVLEGKSWAFDKVNYDNPNKPKSRLGKTRRHTSNRVLNLVDAGFNFIGSAAIGGIDFVDTSAGKLTDIITSRQSPRAFGYGKKIKNALLDNFVKEPAVEGLWKGVAKGKSRKKSVKDFSYRGSARNKKA